MQKRPASLWPKEPRSLLRKCLKLEGGDLGDSWNDWIIAQALLKEAKALMERPSAPVAESSGPK
jgi:hypothetical protein